MRDAAKTVMRFEKLYVRPRQGPALVVGSRVYAGRADRRQLYKHAVGVDMLPGEGVDVVANLEETQAPGGPYAHADCISVLEHSRRPWLLAANLERSLVHGGTLFVEVPFVWKVHGYPLDYWRFTAAGVRELFPGIDWKLIEYAHAKTTAEQEPLPKQVLNDWQFFPRTEVCAFGVKK